MALIGYNTQIQPPNLPPEWVRTPVPTFTAGVGGTYDLRNDVIDQEGDSLTFVKTVGSWPTGVSMASNGVITATTAVTTGATGITVTVDDGTNSPVASASFDVTVPSATAKRWNPGHYVKTQGQHAKNDQVDYWNGVNSRIINEVEDIPELLGAYVTVAWGAVNTTGSTFDFTEIDNTLSILSARGKKMVLEVSYKSFTNNTSSPEKLAPADLSSQCDPTSRGWWGGVHRTATMTRFIACLQAIADRYDDNPDFEMVLTAETSPSFGSNPGDPSDYEKADYVVELKRLYDEMGTMFVKTNACPHQNYLSGYTSELLEYVYQDGNLGVGAPDARSNVVTWILFEGNDSGTETAVRDYRGTIPRPAIASNSTLTEQGPATAVIDRCQTQQATHVFWVTGLSGSGITWTDIKTAIQADPTVHTTCPTNYGSCET